MAENPCATPGLAVEILHHQVWRSARYPHSIGPGNRNVWAGARKAGKLAFQADFPAPVERPDSTPAAEQSVALLDGRGEAPPSHTWRGLAYVCGLSGYPSYGFGQAPDCRMPCVLDSALQTLRQSESSVPTG